MTYRVIFQPRALSDLRAQYEYLAERNPIAATRWFNQFVKGLESLAEFPHRCAVSSESRRAGREVRQYIFGHRGNAQVRIFRYRCRIGENTVYSSLGEQSESDAG